MTDRPLNTIPVLEYIPPDIQDFEPIDILSHTIITHFTMTDSTDNMKGYLNIFHLEDIKLKEKLDASPEKKEQFNQYCDRHPVFLERYRILTKMYHLFSELKYYYILAQEC